VDDDRAGESDGRLRLSLELEPGSEPVIGCLDDGETRRSFEGWSALTRVIELALDAHRPPA
jgi:hypothetical protein